MVIGSIRVIIEGAQDKERDLFIKSVGKILYALPIIDSYVVEIPEERAEEMKRMVGAKRVSYSSKITAQMNVAIKSISAERSQSRGVTGQGVAIAIIDTGISPVKDFTMPVNRIAAFQDFINGKTEPYDDNGHGTHVAGIACGNGYASAGKYVGVAPESRIIGVKALDENGRGNSADVLAALQWIADNKERYNIRVANLSVGADETGSRDPLVRAVEAVWDTGVIVTVAAGNNGPMKCSVMSPGISRKVITIGASDDDESVQIWGDTLKNYSGRGPTADCIVKPDVIAPGADIVSCLTATPPASRRKNKSKIVSDDYIRMSGTSMSAPLVAGAIALLLQKNPDLSPDDVKYMIKKTSVNMRRPQNQQGWGLINVNNLLSEEAVYVRKHK
jgi:serine protease AprX